MKPEKLGAALKLSVLLMLTLVPRTSVAGAVVAGAVVAGAAVSGVVVSAEAELPSGTATMVTAKIRFLTTLLANLSTNLSANLLSTSLSTATVARQFIGSQMFCGDLLIS